MSRVQSSSSASTVGIKDTAGNPLTSTGGALDVNITSGGSATSSIYAYNEVTNVVVGLETDITAYTVSNPGGAYLQYVGASGGNIGEVRVYINSNIVDKSYLYYTGFNLQFDYRTQLGGSPGYMLAQGDMVVIKGLNNGQDTCNFNAKIQLVEVS